MQLSQDTALLHEGFFQHGKLRDYGRQRRLPLKNKAMKTKNSPCFLLKIKSLLGTFNSVSDPNWESGSGSRQAEVVPQKREKRRKITRFLLG
jgi:hypothetical protein